MVKGARVVLAAGLLLAAACARGPGPGASFRTPGAPISSIALFDPARLDGDWREVAGYPLGRACDSAAALRFEGSGTRLAGRACHLAVPDGAVLVPAGPGRFATPAGEVWVLWVDADYRTLVLGTPSGRFGAVLNRGGPISDDRLEAARRILAFNGYDPARLQLRD